MKRDWWILVVAVLAIAVGGAKLFSNAQHEGRHNGWSFNFGGERGSGSEKTEQRNVSAFTGVDIGGAFDVEIICGEKPSVEITGDDNLLQFVSTEVRGGVLVIDTKESIKPRNTIRIKITTNDLTALTSSGASDIVLSKVNNDKLRIETSGAGSVKAEVKTKALSVETHGAGEIMLEGEAETFTAQTTGAGDVNAKELKAQIVKVSVTGAGDIDVTALKELEASISGAGDVTYYGKPNSVSRKIMGVGSISNGDE